MAALTKSAARSRMRQHIRDTVTTYEYSDTIVDGYLAAALEEIKTHVLEVDPDFYLKSIVVKLYTDALDKVATDGSEQGFEYYPLPPNCASVRKAERADGGYHYPIPIVDPSAQEQHRHAPFSTGRVTKDDGATYTTLAGAMSVGSIAIYGDRFRFIPPPSAAGEEVRLYFEEDVASPTGEAEPLKIPSGFNEALTLAWGEKIVDEDDPALAAAIGKKLRGDGVKDPGELVRAKEKARKRTVRSVKPRAVW